MRRWPRRRGGEPATLETFADICCTLMLACERAGDVERPQQWSSVLEDFVRKVRPCGPPCVLPDLLCRCVRREWPRRCRRGGTRSGDKRVDGCRSAIPVCQSGCSSWPRSGCSRAVSMRPRSSWRGSMVSPTRLALRSRSGLREGPAPAAALLVRRLDDLGRTSALAVPFLEQLVDARIAEVSTGRGDGGC